MRTGGSMPGEPQAQPAVPGRPLEDRHLAFLSRSAVDVSPRLRKVLLLAALIGVALIVTESLVAGQAATVRVDKILHFSGYGILALVLVLGLGVSRGMLALAAMVAMGFGIELLQTQTGRTYDLRDAYANALGVLAGGAVGFVLRGAYAYVRREFATAELRRRLVSFGPGEVVIREGDRARGFFIVKSGRIRLTRGAGDSVEELGSAGPGEAIGARASIEGGVQPATATVVERATLYAMDFARLRDHRGRPPRAAPGVLAATFEKLRRLADALN
jgi:VanZ family protein